MIVASSELPSEVFTRFVRGWLALLARGEFAQAASALDEPNSYGQRWRADEIQAALRDYGGGTLPPVSDPDTLGSGGRPDLVALADGSGYDFQHDLPLAGAWSDLTVQFEFRRRPGGFAVALHDIHVL